LEKPDASMEDLVKEADEIVASEIKERQRLREEEAKTAEMSAQTAVADVMALNN
jgi:hypothetical protein